MKFEKKRSNSDKSRTLPEVINALFSFMFDGLCCLKCCVDEGHLGFYSCRLLLLFCRHIDFFEHLGRAVRFFSRFVCFGFV